MAWIMKNWRLLVLLAAVAALVALGVAMRGTVDKPVIAAAKSDASAARGVTLAVQDARSVEHQAAASDAVASTDYQKGLEDGKTRLQGTLDRLGATLRLRDQQLADARAGHLPTASAGAGRRDASAPTDFLAAHGDDALRLAAEADDAIRQLTACQVMLANDRKVLADQ